MDVKYIGIKAPAFAGFIALLAVSSVNYRMDFNQNDWLRQQIQLRHHPSPSFQLIENSLHNDLFLIQRDFKVHFVAQIYMGYTKALTLTKADNAEAKEQVQTTNSRHTALVRQRTIQDFILNPLTNYRKTVSVHIFSVSEPKPFDNIVFFKTLEAETHG